MLKATREKLQEFLDMLESDVRIADKFGDRKAKKVLENYRNDFKDLLAEIDNLEVAQ